MFERKELCGFNAPPPGVSCTRSENAEVSSSWTVNNNGRGPVPEEVPCLIPLPADQNLTPTHTVSLSQGDQAGVRLHLWGFPTPRLLQGKSGQASPVGGGRGGGGGSPDGGDPADTRCESGSAPYPPCPEGNVHVVHNRTLVSLMGWINNSPRSTRRVAWCITPCWKPGVRAYKGANLLFQLQGTGAYTCVPW